MQKMQLLCFVSLCISFFFLLNNLCIRNFIYEKWMFMTILAEVVIEVQSLSQTLCATPHIPSVGDVVK